MTAGQRLREEGRQEGRKEGRAEGRNEGRAEGERALLLKLLKLRFHDVPAGVTARVGHAGLADIERWAERTLIADRIDDVFAP